MSSVTTNALRTSLRRAVSCSRYSSTQASTSLPPSSSSHQKLDVQPKAELTEDKLRALVDLYHQSSSFITKANLSERIDDAFIHRRRNQRMMHVVESSMKRLESDLYMRQNRPKYGQHHVPTSKNQPAPKDQGWSDGRSDREAAVFSTLYGLYGPATPAYDALMDEQRGPEVEVEAVEAVEAEGERKSA